MRRFVYVPCFVLACVLAATTARAQNLVVNGSFETNTAGVTQFSTTNATFSAFLTPLTAFGDKEGIDIMTLGSGYGQNPQNGSWKIAPSSNLGSVREAFSFPLSTPLASGTSYDLSFYFERLVSGQWDGGVVEVGVSTVGSAFGTLVYTSAAAVDGWTHATSTFVSPANAGFLTVRLTTTTSSWVGLDNFSVVQTTPVSLQAFSVD
jgi:hypothetical protein